MTTDEFQKSSERLKHEVELLVVELGKHFSRTEAAETAGDYLRALLSGVERKTSWQMSEVEGRSTPYAFQHLLSRSLWDQDEVRDEHQVRVRHGLGAQGILILDETGFLKKGEKSCGVARQYSGTAGRIENSQIGVFAAWATPKGHTLIDRELYLPKEWTEDGKRFTAAGIPDEVEFLTKPQLGRKMVERALQSGFKPEWITADEAYGHDGKLRFWLEDLRQQYVVAVPSNQYVTQGFGQMRVSSLLEGLPENSWKKISVGKGSKGPRFYEWAWVPINHPYESSWSRWVLFRRSFTDPKDIAFYLVFGRKALMLKKVVEVAGSRWCIEECFESAKGEVGLDQYEVRSWVGWYRHITMSLIAHAALVITRAKIFPAKHGKKKSSLTKFKKKQQQWFESAFRKSEGS